MSKDNAKASDTFSLEVKRELLPGEANVLVEVFRDGKLIDTRRRHNLVVNTGKEDMAKRLVVAPTRLYRFMHLGTNAAAATSAQTNIGALVISSNRTCNTAAISGARTAKFIRTWLTTDFSAINIAEAGLFNRITNGAGTMMARVTFTAVDKSAHDTLKITWTIKVN